MAYLDDNGLLYVWNKIKALVTNAVKDKVDKVSGKGLSTNDYTTPEKNKLAGIEEGANKFVHLTTSGNKHIPSGGASGQFLKWSADGTAVWAADNNTTYGKATTTTDGLMAKEDKSKLDGVAAGANNYVHPNTHPASMIAQDETRRFTSDAEKTGWNNHVASKSNPHTVTKAQVGLGNVDNTSDANKPISIATQNALLDKASWGYMQPINAENLIDAKIIFSSIGSQNGQDMLAFHDSFFDVVFNIDGSYKTRSTAGGVTPAWIKNNVFTDAFQTKLNGIAANANNYVHPSTHPASMIAQDTTHRFVTDTEKNTWDAKASTAVVSTTANGLMTKEDKVKLNAFGAASTYALKADIVGMYKYKGSVADASKLPTTGQVTGDVYNIVAPSIYGAAGANVAWDGSKWDSLGEIFTITSITNAQIDTICA